VKLTTAALIDSAARKATAGGIAVAGLTAVFNDATEQRGPAPAGAD
jgi:hypothetical protein